jgi:anti-sigma regulatory factor (Ser/Thr protein kinase)
MMTTGLLLDLRFTLAGLATARRRLACCLAQAELHETRAEDFLLAVHEVMCNAIQHGGGSGQVILYRDASMLRCEVTDHGPGLSHDKIPRTPPGLGTCGRGLWLVHELTDSVTISANGHGTFVALQIRLLPAQATTDRHPRLVQPVPPAAGTPG